MPSKVFDVRKPSLLPDGGHEPKAGWSSLNAFWYDWLLRGCKWTFSPFHRGVVTTYALEVSATGEGDYRDHSFSAFRAVRRSLHEILPIFPPPTRKRNFCSDRVSQGEAEPARLSQFRSSLEKFTRRARPRGCLMRRKNNP
jgi:hypothetical protein